MVHLEENGCWKEDVALMQLMKGVLKKEYLSPAYNIIHSTKPGRIPYTI